MSNGGIRKKSGKRGLTQTGKKRLPRPLDEVDRELLRLKLERPTLTLKALGQLVGMSKNKVYDRISRDEFQRALAELQKDAIQILQEAKAKAARKLVRHIDADERLKDQAKGIFASIAACKAILAKELEPSTNNFYGDITFQAYIDAQGRITVAPTLPETTRGNNGQSETQFSGGGDKVREDDRISDMVGT